MNAIVDTVGENNAAMAILVLQFSIQGAVATVTSVATEQVKDILFGGVKSIVSDYFAENVLKVHEKQWTPSQLDAIYSLSDAAGSFTVDTLISGAAFGIIKGAKNVGKTNEVYNSSVNTNIGKYEEKLIKEALDEGLKISPDKIVSIAKVDGKIVWLEKGQHLGDHKGAGLEHIIEEHGSDFLNKGITKADIPQVLMKAIEEGNIVGKNGTAPVYRTIFNGKPVNIAIGIGDNGFIIRANPINKFKPIE